MDDVLGHDVAGAEVVGGFAILGPVTDWALESRASLAGGSQSDLADGAESLYDTKVVIHRGQFVRGWLLQDGCPDDVSYGEDTLDVRDVIRRSLRDVDDTAVVVGKATHLGDTHLDGHLCRRGSEVHDLAYDHIASLQADGYAGERLYRYDLLVFIVLREPETGRDDGISLH